MSTATVSAALTGQLKQTLPVDLLAPDPLPPGLPIVKHGPDMAHRIVHDEVNKRFGSDVLQYFHSILYTKLPPTVVHEWGVNHCPCKKHVIANKRESGKNEDSRYVVFEFDEKCPYIRGWHVESGAARVAYSWY